MKKVLLVGLLLLIGASANALQYTFSTALTTPNSTEVLKTQDKGVLLKNHNWIFKIAGIATNVIVKAEGSKNNTDWFNMDAGDLSYTYTTNGTYNLTRSNVPIAYTKFTMVSESGGILSTINVSYIGE